ncbi:hypothetical protein C2E23DRAFT_737813 [Lenzites betulinus]|nr:hypothetical protein C2E23DRAFT_737813 [Lenzites betulinus]
MARILQSSRARLSRGGTRLVQGLRERSSWFVHNIIAARPVSVGEASTDCSGLVRLNGLARWEPSARAHPKIRRRLPRATRLEPDQLEVMVARQEVRIQSTPTRSRGCLMAECEQVSCSEPSDEEAAAGPVSSPPAGGKTLKSVRRQKRIGGRAVVALNVVDEDESDSEDFGRSFSYVDEESYDPSEYHTAISHTTDLSGLGNPAVPQLVDESSGAVFVRIAMGPEEHLHPTRGSTAGKFQPRRTSSVPTSSISEATPAFLAAPSLMLTLPTPQIAQSPVFCPRSPITLFKYVEATTPDYDSDQQALLGSSTSASLSPAPSIPACDRCCLAQLEDGLICRACEKQWLACKMWYQAHDGGRRQWLTAPYITPAESTARIRAVMGLLGVPGTSASARRDPEATRGLGLGSSVSFKQELPFRVLATSSGSSSLHVRSGSRVSSGGARARTAARIGSWATRLGCQIAAVKRVAFSWHDSPALGAARKGLRALWSASTGVLLAGPLSRDGRYVPSRTESGDSLNSICISGHRRPTSSTESSNGSIPSCGPGSDAETWCITSGSRYVEHLTA